jgi:hypothetical protein
MGLDGRDDAAEPPYEALWRQSSQPQSMRKVALPSARVSSQALLNGDTKTEIQTQNHYRDFIACDPILSTLLL